MKKIIISFFICFLGLNSFSQKVSLSGSVKDSLQTPLPYANVIAKPKDVSKNMQFAITDNEGYYKLLLD